MVYVLSSSVNPYVFEKEELICRKDNKDELNFKMHFDHLVQQIQMGNKCQC